MHGSKKGHMLGELMKYAHMRTGEKLKEKFGMVGKAKANATDAGEDKSAEVEDKGGIVQDKTDQDFNDMKLEENDLASLLRALNIEPGDTTDADAAAKAKFKKLK